MRARRARLYVAPVLAWCLVTAWIAWPQVALSHGSLTTTVLFDREIVRILNSHCVMCHSDQSLSFPLSTYEQTWVRGPSIRTEVLRRHMPPWPGVAGYGQFANDNSLTVRETQFMVSWVEGLGPRNAGTVFLNVARPGAAPPEVRASAHAGHWQLGEPDLARPLDAAKVEAGRPDFVQRTIVESGLTSERLVRAIEYMPGDRRVVRAADFFVERTGQWLGSWTPWYGFVKLPDGVVARLPARSRIVAVVHYRGTTEPVVDRGTLGLFFATAPKPAFSSDLILDAKSEVGAAAPNVGAAPRDVGAASPNVGAASPNVGAASPNVGAASPNVGAAFRRPINGDSTQTLRATTRITSDTRVWALRPELVPGITSIEVSARTPEGETQVLLYARDPSVEWPTPYLTKGPRLLRKGADVSVVVRRNPTGDESRPARMRLTISRY